MSLCLAAGKFMVALAAQTFTLAWTHSIEKIRWEEDYSIQNGRLVAQAARIQGSGAGMEPPANAVFKEGRWHYVPAITVHRELLLARSVHTPDYELCLNGHCEPMGRHIPVSAGTTRLSACPLDVEVEVPATPPR